MSTAIIGRPAVIDEVRQFNDIPDDCFTRCTWTGKDGFSPQSWQFPNGCWVLRRTHPDCGRHRESS